LCLEELRSTPALELHVIRPTRTASTLLVSKVGVINDERFDTIVEILKNIYILDAIFLHPVSCLDVSFENRPPKTEALMLHLATHLQQWADVSETVHDEPQFLYGLNKIDASDRARGL
jgi:hypothetical protein